MPHGSRISVDGKSHYSVAMMSGELFEIDALELSVNRILSLDNNSKYRNALHHSKIKPTWVSPHPNGKTLYIAGNGSNQIFVVDLESFSITDTLSTGEGPYNLAISPNGKFLLATLKSEGAVSIWSLKNNKFLKKIKNTTSVSHGVVVSPDNKYAFISLEGVGGEPGKVDVINLETLSLQGSVNVGKQAGGIAFWKIEQ
jgi:YVTN family beta-propeller protein